MTVGAVLGTAHRNRRFFQIVGACIEEKAVKVKKPVQSLKLRYLAGTWVSHVDTDT